MPLSHTHTACGQTNKHHEHKITVAHRCASTQTTQPQKQLQFVELCSTVTFLLKIEGILFFCCQVSYLTKCYTVVVVVISQQEKETLSSIINCQIWLQM